MLICLLKIHKRKELKFVLCWHIFKSLYIWLFPSCVVFCCVVFCCEIFIFFSLSFISLKKRTLDADVGQLLYVRNGRIFSKNYKNWINFWFTSPWGEPIMVEIAELKKVSKVVLSLLGLPLYPTLTFLHNCLFLTL